MPRVAVAVALLAASACGRIDFDGTPGPDATVTPDACPACAAFQPVVGGCTDADAGPFQLAGTAPTQGGGYGVWVAPPFILRADTTGGLHSLAFDGATFTQLDALPNLGWVEAVWSEGSTLFVGAPGTGLAAVDLSPTGELALITQDTGTLKEARRGWAAGDTLYVPTGGSGLHAVRWDGTTLTPIGTALPTVGWAQSAWARGTRVLFADANALRVVDFDGSTFNEPVPRDTTHPGTSRVWSDGTTIFVAHGSGATAYRIVGNALVELDSYTTTDAARDIWSDGYHVFVAAQSAGLIALRFANDTFTLVDTIATGTQALGVFGDGTYVYSNDLAGGLRAHTGFRCQRW